MQSVKTNSAKRFPLVLIGAELDQLVQERALKRIEDGADVIIYSDDFKPLARYEGETYSEEIVFKRAEQRE